MTNTNPTKEPRAEAVRLIAELLDENAECYSENAMDRAFLGNSEELAGLLVDCLALSPSSPVPASGGVETVYRFLEVGDLIEPGDECPSDNCERWEPVNRWAIGSPRSAIFKIIRRRVASLSPALTSGAEAGGEPRCEYCADAGDVHSIDGEWRGYCTCAAGVALAAEGSRAERFIKEGVHLGLMPTDKRTFENRAGAVDEEEQTFDQGIDFALEQLCGYLCVDQKSVTWDAATETLDGDVQSVIGSIMRAKFGEDWSRAKPASEPAGGDAQSLREVIGDAMEMLNQYRGAAVQLVIDKLDAALSPSSGGRE
jgi:hypothetical protein